MWSKAEQAFFISDLDLAGEAFSIRVSHLDDPPKKAMVERFRKSDLERLAAAGGRRHDLPVRRIRRLAIGGVDGERRPRS